MKRSDFDTHIWPHALVLPTITSCWTHTQADVSFIAVCTVAPCIYELQQAACVNNDNVVFVQSVLLALPNRSQTRCGAIFFHSLLTE